MPRRYRRRKKRAQPIEHLAASGEVDNYLAAKSLQ
jgi:hypothetical protein